MLVTLGFAHEMWQWVYQNWRWIVGIVGTFLFGGFGLYFAWRRYRYEKAKRGEDFRRTLEEGRDWQQKGEEPWNTLEERYQRYEALRRADSTYQSAYEYARSRKERAYVCLHRAICAKALTALAEEQEQKDLLSKSEQWFQKGLQYSRGAMVERALSEACSYAKRAKGSHDWSESMARFLYSKAMKWERNKKQAANIAYELGEWLDSIGDYHAAKEAFQYCHQLNPLHDKVLYKMAMVDISLGPDHYQAAKENLRQHLRQHPDDSEARTWFEIMEEADQK